MKELYKRRPTLPKIDEDLTYLANDSDEGISSNESVDEEHEILDTFDGGGPSQSDLALLKAKTSQLNLKTRRPSYLVWTQECQNLSRVHSKRNSLETREIAFTEEAATRIDNSLQWIRNELESMRIHDQALAKTFLKLRSEIHELKLKWSCEDHKGLIDDTRQDIQEVKILKMICDRPLEPLQSEHLRKFGVTKMNISSRRFSTC